MTPEEIRKEEMFASHEEYVKTGSRERLDKFESSSPDWFTYLAEKTKNKVFELQPYDRQVYQYPASVQREARLFFNSFQVPEVTIPLSEDKERFPFWVKGLEQLKMVGGDLYSKAIVRAARNYIDRHEEGFEIHDPMDVMKIFKSALEEIEMEESSIIELKPKKTAKTSKSALKSLRKRS